MALCVPPSVRTAMAVKALEAGRDVLLEKPPAATLGAVERMTAAARANGRVLFATWHSRFAPCVPAAKAWLAGKKVARAAIVWKEDVRRWHPGQAWIWQPSGFGVFDPGINALSILTEILPGAFVVDGATLSFPENCATPIAAEVAMTGAGGYPVTMDLDWRQEGTQTWDITVETDGGTLGLSLGGAAMAVDGAEVERGAGAGVSRDLPPLRRAPRRAGERRRRGAAADLRRRLPARRAAVRRAVSRLSQSRRETGRRDDDTTLFRHLAGRAHALHRRRRRSTSRG